jgi:excisionase family DNA binding protein
MTEEQRGWLTVAQVAEELQVDQETVRRWIRSNELKALNLGGRRPDYRLRRDDLAAFIQRRYGEQGKAAA